MQCVINGCYLARDFQGHHIRARGAGGSDGPWNRLGVCRIHHNEIESIGESAFIKLYPEAEAFIVRARKIEDLWRLWKSGKLDPAGLSKEEQILYRQMLTQIEVWKRFPK